MLLVLSAIVSSCIEPIQLELPSSEEKITVYGWITSENKSHEVRISRTLGFNDHSEYPPITGAEVYVIDRIGARYDFVEDGASGIYRSDSTDLVSAIGDEFILHILTSQGLHIISAEEGIKRLPPITSTTIEFASNPDDVDLEPGEPNYFVSGFIQDEATIKNFYRWQVLVNDRLRNLPEELVLFDDQFTDGNLFRFDASNVLFAENDRVSIVHMSLSQNAYKYYSSLKDLTGTDLVGPIVQSFALQGNLVEVNEGLEILGYFGASDIHVVEVR